MNSTKNITIIVLIATAAILGCLLVGSYLTSPAYGEVSVSKGNYIMSEGAWSSSIGLLYVVDIQARSMNVYFANRNSRSIDLVDTINLERSFAQ